MKIVIDTNFLVSAILKDRTPEKIVLFVAEHDEFSLTKTNKLLQEFETKYQISSDFFFTHWTAEDLEGGDEEYVSWAGELKIKKRLTNSLQKLEAIEYVTQ